MFFSRTFRMKMYLKQTRENRMIYILNLNCLIKSQIMTFRYYWNILIAIIDKIIISIRIMFCFCWYGLFKSIASVKSIVCGNSDKIIYMHWTFFQKFVISTNLSNMIKYEYCTWQRKQKLLKQCNPTKLSQ